MRACSRYRQRLEDSGRRLKAIEVTNVEKRYGALQALDGVSLAVEKGEFFGLLGPNGAGKTTLINVIAGLVRADAGSASVMGADVSADYRRARRMLGVVPQELVFDPFFTVRETLQLQSGYFGIRANDAWIDEVMVHLDLTAKADVNMRALSGGMKAIEPLGNGCSRLVTEATVEVEGSERPALVAETLSLVYE